MRWTYVRKRFGLLKGAGSVACAVLWGIAGSPVAHAQSVAPPKPVVSAPLDTVPPKINFDIVSFKRCAPDKYGTTKVDMPMTADYLAYHCESLSRIIYFAYSGAVKVYSLETNYPKWVDENRYEFVVKVAPEDFAAWQKLDLPARRLVIRTVLVDAVKLKLRVDNSPKPIYALTTMKKVKLTPYKDGDQTKLPDGRVQSGRVHDWIGYTSYFQNFSMPDLAEILTANMDRVVADHTDLKGTFTFVIPFGGNNLQPDTHLGAEDGPTVREGLEQLGLRLEPAKGPVERLVIDHIEEPAVD